MKPEEMDQVPAGAELDALIHKHIFDDKELGKTEDLVEITWPWGKERRHVLRPALLPFSTEIAAAWIVFEKLDSQGYCLSLFRPMDDSAAKVYGRHWTVQAYHPRLGRTPEQAERGEPCFVWASADTPMLAICKLGLKVVFKEKQS